jgi:hypothetical protein
MRLQFNVSWLTIWMITSNPNSTSTPSLLVPFAIDQLGGLRPLAHNQLFCNPAQNWLPYTLPNVTLFVDFVNISTNTIQLSWPQSQSQIIHACIHSLLQCHPACTSIHLPRLAICSHQQLLSSHIRIRPGTELSGVEMGNPLLLGLITMLISLWTSSTDLC